MKYTVARRAVDQDTPQLVLITALRRVGLDEQADSLADLVAYRIREMSGTEPWNDELSYDWELGLTKSAFAALVAATSRPDAADLLTASIGMLEVLDVGFTADAIRGHELGGVPAAVLDTPVARLAYRAAQALVGATRIPACQR
ncbi:hypothetical protein [Lentzea sp. NPDC092896]|uniref:hypothetical protein n=1 Tax=Lentzea sp. NPDC092896 TaxID=3364127 RepID=UPI0037F3FC31